MVRARYPWVCAVGRSGTAPPRTIADDVQWNRSALMTLGPEGDDGVSIRFRDQVALWLEVWTADAPELREQARAAVDPDRDPWGYLIALGELVAARD